MNNLICFKVNGNENDNNEGNANSEVMAMNIIAMGGRGLDVGEDSRNSTRQNRFRKWNKIEEEKVKRDNSEICNRFVIP